MRKRIELRVTKKAVANATSKETSLKIPRIVPIKGAFQFLIRQLGNTSIKQRIAYVLFSMALGEILFLSMHPHYELGLLEFGEAGLICSLGVILYFTNFHRYFMSLFNALYKHVELNGFDRIQYFIANVTMKFCRPFRKTQTGILSTNMLMMLAGILLLLTLLIFTR